MTVRVEFEPVGRRGDCPSGVSLLACARLLGVDLASLCGGTGSCGRCIVQVLDGDVSDPGPVERDCLGREQLAEGYRLACRAVPMGDCKVHVPPESLTAPQRTQVEGEEVAVAVEPAVEVLEVSLTAPSLDDLVADTERFAEALLRQHGITCRIPSLAVVRALPSHMRECAWQGRAVVRDGDIVALLPVDSRPLGLAVDLGTTKIACYLVDLETGRTLAADGVMNPQIAYGEDVIARMAHAQRDAAQAAELQHLVVNALNRAVGEMCAKASAAASRESPAGIRPDDIVDIVVAGNTAMHHLFLRLPVEQLARAPYVPAVSAALDINAGELGVLAAPGTSVHLLPSIAGYVGGDHVAALLSTGLGDVRGVGLLVDIGTNTEVCLAKDGVLTSTSCASGPAFEGAHIKHGMRAANGAIEHVRLVGDRVEYQTIGGARPVGLCGSGILDALAQLYRAGVLNGGGRMGAHPRVRAAGGEGRAAGREFVLVEGSEGAGGTQAITLTQKDVRELQLAKGAMRTGLNILLQTSGLEADDIEEVIIAGAFGSYIDVSSAITIGMLPDLPLARFRQVGNAAGMGAKLALLSRSKRARAGELARRVRYVELATQPGFASAFARSTFLDINET